jgi:nitroreductase
MMDVLEAIFTRRSIRKYTGVKISEDELHTILRAGFYAPSAKDKRPWHFIVVRDHEKLVSIADGLTYGKMIPHADCVIVVCGSKSIHNKVGYLVEDCSASIQNMLLAVHGLGLGAVWCGLYPVPARTRHLSQILELPPEIVPVGLIALGNKNEERQTPERFDPSRVHFDRW